MLRLLLSATLLLEVSIVGAFQGISTTRREALTLLATKDGQSPIERTASRRDMLLKGVPSCLSVALVAYSQPASALVKGVAPPSTMKPGGGKPKCTNVEECQALAEQKEREEREAAEANRVPAQKTVSSIPYGDLQWKSKGSIILSDFLRQVACSIATTLKELGQL